MTNFFNRFKQIHPKVFSQYWPPRFNPLISSTSAINEYDVIKHISFTEINLLLLDMTILCTHICSQYFWTALLVVYDFHILSRNYFRAIISEGYLQPHYVRWKTMNAAIYCYTVRFQFVIGVHMPQKVWSFIKILPSAQSISFPDFNSFGVQNIQCQSHTFLCDN